MDLQPIFDEPILEQGQFEPEYEGHGKDVHWVRTSADTNVVRFARHAVEGNPFWYGVRHLFGLDPSRLPEQEAVGQVLRDHSHLRVPRVLRSGVMGERRWIVADHLPGTRLSTFGDISSSALVEYGADLARVHSGTESAKFGTVGRCRRPLYEFHARAASTVADVVDRFHADNAGLVTLALSMAGEALALPAPMSASLVHVDIDPTQYLTDGERLTALIDLEAHVMGPREMDFVALEFVFTQEQAEAFAAGYQEIAPLPGLEAVRPFYRLLGFLLEIQDSEDLDDWMDRPALFGSG